MAIYKNYTAGMQLVIQENGEDVYYRFGEANFSGTNGNKFKIAPNFHVLSQDTNATVIRVFLDWVSLGYSGSGGRVYGYINGSQLENSYTSIGANQTNYMGARDITIYHDVASGQGSTNINCKVTTPWSLGSAESNTTIYTNVWPRQANITNATDFNDEENPTIYYSNQAGNNVSSLQARIENSNGTVAYVDYRDVSKTSSQYTFPLTEAERNTLRAACTTNSMTVKFVLRTIISGSTFWSTMNKTMRLVNYNPTFTDFTFEDTNPITVALTGNNQNCINGFSNIQATISTVNKAIANKQATMSKYRFVIGDKSTDITYSADNNVSGTINNAQNGTYQVYAIDNRNNSTLVTKLANETINYQTIYLNPNSSYIQRDNNQVGTAAILTLNGTFWNGDFGTVNNAIESVSYKFKKTNSSTWIDGTTVITPTISDNNFSFSGQIASDNQDTSWDLQDSYNVQIIVEDKLSISTINLILNSAIPTMSIDKNGVGIMCAYDETLGGYLQVNGKKFVSMDDAHPVGSLFFTKNPNFDPNVEFGGTWQKITGKFLYANSGGTYSEGNGTGTSTNSHTLTAAQSGLRGHQHTERGYYSVQSGVAGGAEVRSRWSLSADPEDTVMGSTGGWNATEGHSHNIPYFAPFVWERTA